MLAAALLLHAGAAFAGEPTPVDEPPPDRQQASRHFQRGYELSQTGAFEQASRHFEAAYALEPAATVLYNLGQAYAASGHPVEALRAFRKCLKSADGEVTDALRKRVVEAVRVARGRVGRLTLRVSPPEATVLLDGHPIEQAGLVEAIEVKAGAHVITSQLEGFETGSMVVEVPPEGKADVSVALEPRTAPGHIMVTCPLSDVEVSIDGVVSTRRTPLLAPIAASPGEHTVGLSRPGYRDDRFVLTVAPGEMARLSCRAEVNPRASSSVMGTLAIERVPIHMDPSKVAVYVDGRQTPWQGGPLRLPMGRHDVELRQRNYEPWFRPVSLPAQAALRLEPDWVPTAEYRHEMKAAARKRAQWAIAAWGAGAAAGVSAAVLGFVAKRRHNDWLRERNDLNQSSADEPDTLVRLRDNHERALGIQRLNDAAIGLGVVAASLLGAGAVLQWWGEPPLEPSEKASFDGSRLGLFIHPHGASFRYAGTL